MRLNLAGDILMSSAFNARMLETTGALPFVSYNCNRNNTNNNNRNNNNNNNNNNGETINMGYQRPVIDLLVALVAVPVMIVCALQLEKNLQDMANSPESRWVVFALGVSMLVISVLICGYITHRMGVCMWAGPIDELGNRIDGHNILHINSQNDILRIVDSMPPSYESVMKFDIPPPPYDCLVIDMEDCKDNNSDSTETTNLTRNSINSTRSTLALISVHTSNPTSTTATIINNTTTATTAANNTTNNLSGKLMPLEASAMHI